MSKYKIAIFFLAGILSGIFIAQGVIILAARHGGNFGGEVLIIPMIIALIYMGACIGRTFPSKKELEQHYQHGYQAGRLSMFIEQDFGERIFFDVEIDDCRTPTSVPEP